MKRQIHILPERLAKKNVKIHLKGFLFYRVNFCLKPRPGCHVGIGDCFYCVGYYSPVLSSVGAGIYFPWNTSSAMFGHILHVAAENDGVKQDSRKNVSHK